MTNYHEYLQLDKILGSQKPLYPSAHDEMLFITVHQSYELWFKQILFEMRHLASQLSSNDLFNSISSVSRVLTILKTLVHQTDILETMSPISFASFRDHLSQASGMQSLQFREVEFFLGVKNPRWLERFSSNPNAHARLTDALNNPSIYDHFLRLLAHQFPHSLNNEVIERDFSQNYTGDEKVVDILQGIYQAGGPLHILCEKLVDLDEGFLEWRYRHIKMVERTIGQKMGTGGTAGVDYLRNSLFRPAFVDLWAVRDRF